MAEGVVDERLMGRLAAQLRERDEREELRRLAAAEAAVPPKESLIQYGPVPEEYTPVPGPASLGPGGMGPRVEIDPRFGEFPLIGSSQERLLTLPRGNPRREEHYVRKGYANPASVDAYYPAVQDAYLRHLGARAGDVAQRRTPQSQQARDRLHDEYLDARSQAWDYADPGATAFGERERLLEEARAREAAKQMALERMFGTPQDRAEGIISLEALRRLR